MWRKKPTVPSVEMRFRVNGNVVFDSTAEQMYYAAKYGGTDDDGWLDVLNTDGIFATYVTDRARVQLEFRPVRTEVTERMLRFWLYFVLYFVAGMVSGGALMWAVTP